MKENSHKLIPLALNKVTIVETKQKFTQVNFLKVFKRDALQIIRIESQVLRYDTKKRQVCKKVAQAYQEYKHLM